MAKKTRGTGEETINPSNYKCMNVGFLGLNADVVRMGMAILLFSASSRLPAIDEVELLRDGIRKTQRDLQNPRVEICYAFYNGASQREAEKLEQGCVTYQLAGDGKFCARGTRLGSDFVKCRNESYGFYLQKPTEVSGSVYLLSWLYQTTTKDLNAKALLVRESEDAYNVVFQNYQVVGMYVWDFLALEGLTIEFVPEDSETKRMRYKFKLDSSSSISKSMEVTHGELIFDQTRNWALTKIHIASSRKPGQYVTEEIKNVVYPNGPVLTESLVFKRYVNNKLDYYHKSEFRNINENFDDGKFYLSSYGLDEPNFGRKWGTWAWVLLAAIVFLALSIWVRNKH